jgi:hypothetical protein
VSLSAATHCSSLALLLTIALLGKAEHGSRILKATDRDALGWKEDTLMDRPWFDQETDVLLLDEYIVEMDSYKRIVEDGNITDTELFEQTLRVVTLMRRLEEALSPEAKAIATEAFGEMAVLNALQALRLQATSALP